MQSKKNIKNILKMKCTRVNGIGGVDLHNLDRFYKRIESS